MDDAHNFDKITRVIGNEFMNYLNFSVSQNRQYTLTDGQILRTEVSVKDGTESNVAVYAIRITVKIITARVNHVAVYRLVCRHSWYTASECWTLYLNTSEKHFALKSEILCSRQHFDDFE